MSVYKILSNNTLLNGTLIRLPVNIDSEQTTDDKTDDSYDSQGAMQFIIATIMVYSVIGVFCTLILRIKRFRGKGHANYLQDESIVKYLKKETDLKQDGHKMKMAQECSFVAERVKRYEEKRSLLDLEKELTADFGASPTIEQKHILKHKRRRKKKSDLGNTISKMGVSLFYMDGKPNPSAADDVSTLSDNSHDIELHVDLIQPQPHEHNISFEMKTNNKLLLDKNNHIYHSEMETDI